MATRRKPKRAREGADGLEAKRKKAASVGISHGEGAKFQRPRPRSTPSSPDYGLRRWSSQRGLHRWVEDFRGPRSSLPVPATTPLAPTGSDGSTGRGPARP